MSEQCSKLPAAVQEQVNILDQSNAKVILIIAATILSYYASHVQKEQLICAAQDSENCDCLPKLLPLRMISSVMVISALLFFTDLTESTLQQPTEDPQQCKKNKLNHLSNQLALAAAAIRFGLLTTNDTDLEE